MTAAPHVLVLGGSAHRDGHLRQCLDIVENSANDAGGVVRRLDLDSHQLPVMRFGDSDQAALPAVQEARRLAAWADAFVLGTPEYHGNLSGALKNWMDYMYAEFAGKVAGIVAATGGSNGEMSTTAVRNSFVWCHGFVLPFTAAARGSSFTDEILTDERVIDRLQRVGHDVVRYAKVLRPAFQTAAAAGPGVRNGFAGLHPPQAEQDG